MLAISCSGVKKHPKFLYNTIFQNYVKANFIKLLEDDADCLLWLPRPGLPTHLPAENKGHKPILPQRVLQQLKKHIRQKHTDIWHNWILQQNNARQHVVALVTAWLESQNIDTMLHPSYSPDITSCDGATRSQVLVRSGACSCHTNVFQESLGGGIFANQPWEMAWTSWRIHPQLCWLLWKRYCFESMVPNSDTGILNDMSEWFV